MRRAPCPTSRPRPRCFAGIPTCSPPSRRPGRSRATPMARSWRSPRGRSGLRRRRRHGSGLCVARGPSGISSAVAEDRRQRRAARKRPGRLHAERGGPDPRGHRLGSRKPEALRGKPRQGQDRRDLVRRTRLGLRALGSGRPAAGPRNEGGCPAEEPLGLQRGGGLAVAGRQRHARVDALPLRPREREDTPEDSVAAGWNASLQ